MSWPVTWNHFWQSAFRKHGTSLIHWKCPRWLGYVKALNISKHGKRGRNRKGESWDGEREKGVRALVCVSKTRGTVRGSGMPNYSQTLPLIYLTLSGLLTTADALQTPPRPTEKHHHRTQRSPLYKHWTLVVANINCPVTDQRAFILCYCIWWFDTAAELSSLEASLFQLEQ